MSYSSRVDSNTIVLVVHGSTVDNNVGTATDIETIGVVATCGVTGPVVNCHAVDGQPITAIDTDSLNGSVLDVEVVDNGRAGQTVGSEELGLGLATVTSLSIPPAGTVWVELRTAGTGHSDILALNLQQRTCPLLVAPSSGTFKDNLEQIQ